ncbi:MAG: hypothetical protein HY747_00985 [Elusimicrobia bacterium]|nr:hypothetical protein [Elusimicrobiota bacterium]
MRILILRLSSMGDIALLSPVFEEIKRAHPTCRVSCLVKGIYADLVSRHPALDEVIVFQGFWKTLRLLRQRQWDAVIDLHGVLRTRLIAFFLPARWKTTYKKEDVLKRWGMVFLNKTGPAPHTIDRYRTALAVLGIGLNKIVVLQTAFLGDAVLTLPLLKLIQERLGPERLSVVTRPEHAPVFERESFEVIKDDKRAKDSGWSGFWRLVNVLRSGSYDAVLVPHRSLRSAAMAWFAGIPIRAGFFSSAGWFFFNRRVPFVWSEHDADRNMRLLETFPSKGSNQNFPNSPRPVKRGEDKGEGFEGQTPHPALSPLAQGEGKKIFGVESGDLTPLRLWRSFGADTEKEFLIGMAPGSKWPTKRWPVQHFAETAGRLLDTHVNGRIVLTGGPEDKELCAQTAVLLGSKTINTAGRVGLGDLPGLMSQLRLFVTNDSGPMHIASGLGVPTVAVFGPTVRGFGFFPKGPDSRVVEIEDLACRPCSLHGGKHCPRGHFLCMRLITPDRVIDACENVLKHENSPVA